MSGIRSLRRGPTLVGYASATSAPVYVDSDDNRVKVVPAGTGSAEIVLQENGAGSAEVVTATNVIRADESGKTFFLNSATEFVSTLPAPALGLRFMFIVAAAPSGASYTVIAAAAATIIKGDVLTSQDGGGSSDSGTAGELTVTFVDGKAVAGDWAAFECDGTNWFVRAGSKVFDAITIS